MNKNIAKKWTKALRSGKYKQGFGALKQIGLDNKEYHCCLGVLCELYNEDMKKNKKKTLCEKRDLMAFHTFNKEAEVLPHVVQRWAGLNYPTGRYDAFRSLMDRNDSGDSFKKIANLIEKRVDDL